jgi:hypothetical protein
LLSIFLHSSFGFDFFRWQTHWTCSRIHVYTSYSSMPFFQ